MADRFGRMQVATEVPVFQCKVGCDKDFGVARRPKNRAVIPDAELEGFAAGWEIAANLLDQA